MRQLTTFNLFILCILFNLTGLSAQEETTDTAGPWKTGGTIGINFNQVALSNWAGGGAGTFAMGGLLSLTGDYKEAGSHWSNEFGAGYGFTKVGDQNFRKSDDKLTLVSKYDYAVSRLNATDKYAVSRLLYSALLDFRTQLADGLDYEELDTAGNPTRISRFLAPGYLNFGLGGTWKPNQYFEALVAPISNRLIIVLEDDLSAVGAFGVDRGEKIKSELGALSRLKFTKEIVENVTLGSKLNLFGPYNDITTIVVNWETLLSMKVNDYITTSISLDVIYDESVEINRNDGTIGPATQVKEALNIGFGYAL